MTTQLMLIRAVSSEFLRRKLKSTAIVFGSFVIIIDIAVFWLTTRSAWWWVAVIPSVILTLLSLFVYLAANRVVRTVRPELTSLQLSAIKNFVDKLERVAETIHTPVFILVFRLLRDTLWPREKSYIRTIAKDGTTLHKDYLELSKSF